MANNAKTATPARALVLLVGIVLISAGIWMYFVRAREGGPSAPPATTAEAKAYVGNLKLSGVNMKATENYTGAALLEITGEIANAGDRTLERVELNCVFFDSGGIVVFRERVPIVRSRLKPGDKREFRMPFEGIPNSWNQALPTLVIAHVAFAE